jgi:hypothetical protein
MSEVKTLTITEFLLARIADDEEAAGADPGCECLGVQFGIGHGPVCPERVLAECEAKRRIVKRLNNRMRPDVAFEAWYALRVLAAIYADHPDWRGEWRP